MSIHYCCLPYPANIAFVVSDFLSLLFVHLIITEGYQIDGLGG